MANSRDLERRVEKLEDAFGESRRDLFDSITDAEWRALAILQHELLHPPGAEITPEVWSEVERRLRAGSGS